MRAAFDEKQGESDGKMGKIRWSEVTVVYST